MKNKKLTYILLPAVVLIWVLIILRVVNYKGSDDGFQLSSPVAKATKAEIKTDTFSLLLNYPDPFLKHVSSTPLKTRTRNPKNSNKKNSTPPDITYYGLVQNKKVSSGQVNVKINGKYFIMSIGETINEVKLRRIYQDSICITYYGNQYHIKR